MNEKNNRKNENNIYGKTRTKSKKSTLNLEQFKEKIRCVDMNISRFSRYYGISKPTIYGWSNHGVPLYVERIIELLETNKQLHNGINELYEINTKKVRKF
ncbi:hypothetical protein [Aliarcobacter skirrowii]|uniref:hypothetical protein n=1 Tax=Aliarcobacter skirrowii TaxID=28200 RepID=UPI002A362BD0|nr:hypothetical protein [Aliarcobacter skirrowii]MDY0181323.1 hypothetical protein [Aliarcobacter skirrowii]